MHKQTSSNALQNKTHKTLLLSLVFAPDSVSTAILLTELSQQLKNIGNDFTVITTTPHYNYDPEILEMQPLTPLWGKFLFKSECKGIPVYHIRVHAKGKRVITRLFDYLFFHIVSVFVGVRLKEKYDVILASSPPLTIGLCAILLAVLRRVPFVYNVQEIFPDILVGMGSLKNRFLIYILEKMEKFIYARAKVVTVISEKFRQRLLDKGVPASKLCVIPNFVDIDFFQPGERHNAFSLEHQLDDRFVVLYAGNIGLTQDFETIIAAAELVQDNPEICFLIVGDGARREWLEEQIDQQALKNVRYLPYQPHSVVPQLYASSDVCLVPLRRNTAFDTFPSKIYTIMAAGRPVIASADKNSELTWVVEQTKCGIAIPPSDPHALGATVKKVFEAPEGLLGMGKIGREYVVAHHSPEIVAQQYHELLKSMENPK
jgi:colanic acid biosynthesis glycosyl transferase WcaI